MGAPLGEPFQTFELRGLQAFQISREQNSAPSCGFAATPRLETPRFARPARTKKTPDRAGEPLSGVILCCMPGVQIETGYACNMVRRMMRWLSTASRVRWALRSSVVSSFSSFLMRMERLPMEICKACEGSMRCGSTSTVR